MTQDTRPNISDITTGNELRRWYWRKDELVAHARALDLRRTGGKFDILNRIAIFLDTGQPPQENRQSNKSKFDWHSEPLENTTIITDSYKNTQNVRRYFKSQLGEGFKFNIAFMEWMKSNIGRSLADACAAYETIKADQAAHGTRIKSHNQFNQYTRDFLTDNPEMNMDDVRRIWARKIAQPSENGRHIYERSDLKLT